MALEGNPLATYTTAYALGTPRPPPPPPRALLHLDRAERHAKEAFSQRLPGDVPEPSLGAYHEEVHAAFLHRVGAGLDLSSHLSRHRRRYRGRDSESMAPSVPKTFHASGSAVIAPPRTPGRSQGAPSLTASPRFAPRKLEPGRGSAPASVLDLASDIQREGRNAAIAVAAHVSSDAEEVRPVLSELNIKSCSHSLWPQPPAVARGRVRGGATPPEVDDCDRLKLVDRHRLGALEGPVVPGFDFAELDQRLRAAPNQGCQCHDHDGPHEVVDLFAVGGHGLPPGAVSHLDAYAGAAPWCVGTLGFHQTTEQFGLSRNPAVLPTNCPTARLHRQAKWALHDDEPTCARRVEDVAVHGSAVVHGGVALAQQLAEADGNRDAQLALAPKIAANCFEMPKEEALLAAVRLGNAARAAAARSAAVLHEAALALIGSAATRAVDSHSAKFPLDVLEAMVSVSLGTAHYVDMALAAMYPWLLRSAPTAAFADRVARALLWASSALHFAEDGDVFALGPSSKRVVGILREVLSHDPSIESSTLSLMVCLERQTKRHMQY